MNIQGWMNVVQVVGVLTDSIFLESECGILFLEVFENAFN